MADSEFKPISTLSAFGAFACGIGAIWTLITYFQLAGNIMKMQSAKAVPAWSILIPIWGQIVMGTAAEALNDIAKEKGTAGEPLNPMMIIILSFVFSPISFFMLYKKHNEIIGA